jgi:hypothetical protein
MKFTLSWLKDYLDTSAIVDEIANSLRGKNVVAIPTLNTCFSPCGRRWHAVPDEGGLLRALISNICRNFTPHPPFGHLLPQGEKDKELAL